MENDDNRGQPPYHKLKDPHPPPRGGGCGGFFQWLRSRSRRGPAKEAPLKTPADVRSRIAKRLKEINLKLAYWERQMNKLEAKCKAFLAAGQEVRAQAEVRVYKHLEAAHATLVNVQTKLRLLRREMDKLETLQQCMDALHQGTQAMDVMLKDNMSVADIDRMMAKWDVQLHDAQEIGRAMTQETAMSNPENLYPTLQDEDGDAGVLLTHWRLEALAAPPLGGAATTAEDSSDPMGSDESLESDESLPIKRKKKRLVKSD